ncbi:hypothetical protein SAMN05660297_01545 [Natronincola peptidivorans]|uniref:DUF378 domain-containing protein n=1 Tax=Natronincola peptidivorans TaxID=426128 RepID=A0A1I0CAB8_9FIRM|nr:DUF378 domain-containing protein [Natronincola peptidivorans]SET16053.1 hypothetical protein SAMN05660297_01545 [Natronincola peptidivorans]
MLTWIALILIIIGALNWGLVGLFQLDLVAKIFRGQSSLISRIIYTLIGLSGVYTLIMLILRR